MPLRVRLGGLLFLLFCLVSLRAEDAVPPGADPPPANPPADAAVTNTGNPAQDTDTYIAPAGKAPPVAPPLRKGSPLDHLTNDPRTPEPMVGYREGRTGGDTYWIAHRYVDTMDGQGWGWVRKSSDDWDDGKWIALQESPGLAVAPHRKLLTPGADNDWEYKFWGGFATYKAYDPRLDEFLPVFVLQGYEVIGRANPLRIKVGPPGRVRNRASGASSRENQPVLNDPGID